MKTIHNMNIFMKQESFLRANWQLKSLIGKKERKITPFTYWSRAGHTRRPLLKGR